MMCGFSFSSYVLSNLLLEYAIGSDGIWHIQLLVGSSKTSMGRILPDMYERPEVSCLFLDMDAVNINCIIYIMCLSCTVAANA